MKTQICWICRDAIDHELKYGLRLTAKVDEQSTLLRTWKTLFDATNLRERILKDWIELCDNASSKSLSVASDRLPSLSGIASLLQPLLKTRYIAGHWESNLIPSLLWSCNPRSKARPYTGYIAPSWSWASSPRPLQYAFYYPHWFRHQSHVVARVVEVDTTPAGTDQFGALIDGYLRLRAPALPQITSIDGDLEFLIGYTDLPGSVSMRFRIVLDGEAWSPSGHNQRKERFRPWLQSLCWLVLCKNLQAFGIMLERVETRSDGAFRRVGTFREILADRPDDRAKSAVSNLPTQEYLII